MEKMKFKTSDMANKNFLKLVELFPNAVTETVDVDGKVVRAIDKDVLVREINCHVVDGKEERYQFTWPDKKKSVLLANVPSTNTLRPCVEESVGRGGEPGGFDSEIIKNFNESKISHFILSSVGFGDWICKYEANAWGEFADLRILINDKEKLIYGKFYTKK